MRTDVHCRSPSGDGSRYEPTPVGDGEVCVPMCIAGRRRETAPGTSQLLLAMGK